MLAGAAWPERLFAWLDGKAVAAGRSHLFPIEDVRRDALLKLLSACKDNLDFDRIYFKLSAATLQRALGKTLWPELTRLRDAFRGQVKPGDWNAYRTYLNTVCDTPSSGKNRLDFLIDGAEFTPAFDQALDQARKSVHISMFQWQADQTGRAVAEKLVAKAKAGVAVRVMVDEYGTLGEDTQDASALLDFMRQGGVQVEVNPRTTSLSRVDHRKVCVIDGEIGFTGGMNIGNWYQVDWHDQMTRIEGPAVERLQRAFLQRWSSLGGTVPSTPVAELFPPAAEPVGGAESFVVSHAGGGTDRNIKAAFLRAFRTAEHTIRVASPYFADEEVVSELIFAARRGVKVQLVLPREIDVVHLKHASRAFYQDLLAAGVEVYEYTGRMAHEKVAVVDEVWTTFGSSNLDARSLEFNDELNVVVLDRAFAQDVGRRLFDVDLESSARVTEYTTNLLEYLYRKASPFL